MSRLLLVLIPGIGLIHLGRTGRGLLHFFLFANLVNLFLVANLLVSAPSARYAALGGAILIWLWSARDTLRARSARESEPSTQSPPGEGDERS